MIPATIFELRWGTSYGQRWRPPYVPDDVRYWDADRLGSERTQTLAGADLAWIVGTDYYASAAIRWVSRQGWQSDTGFAALLRWARAGSALRLYPSPDTLPDWYATVYVDDPASVRPEPEADFTMRATLVLRGASNFSPVWLAIGPATATDGVTFSRAGTATGLVHT